MHKPSLLVVAGCNGAGKSSFSNALTPSEIVPFDYDSYYLKIYKSLFDSELRDVMAHNMAREQLDNSIEEAITTKTDFCYETNFNSTPMYWPHHFKQHGYQLYMIFFCLDSVETAKERVAIRVANGGHFVAPQEIESRYRLGYQNLDKHFNEFNAIHLFDSSHFGKKPTHILSISQRGVEQKTHLPKFIQEKLPNLTKLSS